RERGLRRTLQRAERFDELAKALLPRDVGREHRRELDDGALVLPDREEPFGELGAERDLAWVQDAASFEPMDGLVRPVELPGKHTGELEVHVGPRRAGALDVALEGGRVARERRARSRLDTRDELRELARCRALKIGRAHVRTPVT